MRKLYENFKLLWIQKRIVAAATIWGIMVIGKAVDLGIFFSTKINNKALTKYILFLLWKLHNPTNFYWSPNVYIYLLIIFRIQFWRDKNEMDVDHHIQDWRFLHFCYFWCICYNFWTLFWAMPCLKLWSMERMSVCSKPYFWPF